MTAFKGTPGPWSYRSQQHDDWGVVRAGRYYICQAKDPKVWSEDDFNAHRRAKTDPWEANARLIAAAPELLEAADRLCKGWLVDEHEDETLCMSAEHHAAISALFAAIAKALGQ